jgi:hypothetical protein
VESFYNVELVLFICRGSEPNGKSVVQLVCRTGGVAVLAHPWALKSPAAAVKDLKAAGLHGIEVYRSDGKVSGTNNVHVITLHDLLKYSLCFFISVCYI